MMAKLHRDAVKSGKSDRAGKSTGSAATLATTKAKKIAKATMPKNGSARQKPATTATHSRPRTEYLVLARGKIVWRTDRYADAVAFHWGWGEDEASIARVIPQQDKPGSPPDAEANRITPRREKLFYLVCGETILTRYLSRSEAEAFRKSWNGFPKSRGEKPLRIVPVVLHSSN